MQPRVDGSPLSVFNLNNYNSSDERLRLNHFKMIRQRTVPRNVPYALIDSLDCMLQNASHHMRVKRQKNSLTWKKLRQNWCI